MLQAVPLLSFTGLKKNKKNFKHKKKKTSKNWIRIWNYSIQYIELCNFGYQICNSFMIINKSETHDLPLRENPACPHTTSSLSSGNQSRSSSTSPPSAFYLLPLQLWTDTDNSSQKQTYRWWDTIATSRRFFLLTAHTLVICRVSGTKCSLSQTDFLIRSLSKTSYGYKMWPKQVIT